jgi:aerobic carbon-monoxide dehydrogenase small subunit
MQHALAIVRQDTALIEQAGDRFGALGLTWHAEQLGRMLAARRPPRRPRPRKEAAVRNVSFTVNKVPHELQLDPRELLVYVLRERLGLTGTVVGCDTSSCGACTVLLDGESVKSCTVLGVQADGHEIGTIEGLAENGSLHPLQESFHQHHALQCGYCTSGMVLAAVSLLEENPRPSEDEIRHALEGNICRCTGYQNIVDAIEAVAR